MVHIDIEGKRFWFTPIQMEVIKSLKKQGVSGGKLFAMCKRSCKAVTDVDGEAPKDQTVKVETAKAGIVGTGLGADATIKTEPVNNLNDLKVLGDEEKGS